MGEFVSHYVERPREAPEDLAVAISIGHLRAVPEGVVHRLKAIAPVGLAHMHARDQRHAGIVERVAAEELEVEIIRVTRIVVGLVNARIGRLRIPLASHELAGKHVFLFCVVDEAVPFSGGRRLHHHRRHLLHERPHRPHGTALYEIDERPLADPRICRPGQVLDHVGRHDALDGMATGDVWHGGPPCEGAQTSGDLPDRSADAHLIGRARRSA